MNLEQADAISLVGLVSKPALVACCSTLGVNNHLPLEDEHEMVRLLVLYHTYLYSRPFELLVEVNSMQGSCSLLCWGRGLGRSFNMNMYDADTVI